LENTNEVLPSRTRALRHFGFVEGSKLCPLSHVIVENTSLPQPNSTYVLWVRQDQLLRSTLISSLSPQVLYLIVDCTTSRSIWLTLENALASPSTRIMTIHIALQELRQHDESVTAYLQRAKHCHDGLAAAGRPLSTALLPLYQPGQNLFLPLVY